MNWITQKTGLINQYNPELHIGKQPIRVLNLMNLYMFSYTHPAFRQELENLLQKNGLSSKIELNEKFEAVKPPFIKADKRSIVLQETFLSYLWCIIHSIYVIYIETIHHPAINKKLGVDKYPKNQRNLDLAYELFAYAKSLIVTYQDWDKSSLPNPEQYMAENRNFIEQPNCFFTEAVKFILCHEYTHALKHLDEINESEQIDNSKYLEFEKEADSDAINLILKGIFPDRINEIAIQVGVTLGIISMFFFKPTTKALKHPNNEDRLIFVLEHLQLSDDNECWGIALVGLELWTEQFGLSYTSNNSMSDKENVYNLVDQIKQSHGNKS